MVRYRGLNINIDTDEILYLMDNRDAEYCMNSPLALHMRESYSNKLQNQ